MQHSRAAWNLITHVCVPLEGWWLATLLVQGIHTHDTLLLLFTSLLCLYSDSTIATLLTRGLFLLL
jgi:hypothetical protein